MEHEKFISYQPMVCYCIQSDCRTLRYMPDQLTSLSFLLVQVGSLVATATDILIKALQIKLAYVNDILARLSPLVSDNPRQTTPAELSFSRYEEWLESNQQLFEFNSQLYELERVKFEMKQKQERVKQTRDGESDADTVGEVYYDSGNSYS